MKIFLKTLLAVAILLFVSGIILYVYAEKKNSSNKKETAGFFITFGWISLAPFLVISTMYLFAQLI